MADRVGALETWTVATFNVVAFTLVLVIVGHETGALADVLPGIGTSPDWQCSATSGRSPA